MRCIANILTGYFLTSFLVLGIIACEVIETREPQQRAKLILIPEVQDDAESSTRAAVSTNGAYLCIKVTKILTTTATVATATLAYTTANVSTGDRSADSVTTKKGFSKLSIRAELVGEYVKKRIDLTKSYHWYILDRDYKIYREVGYTGPDEAVFPWIPYCRSALVIDGSDRPIVQSTKRPPLD